MTTFTRPKPTKKIPVGVPVVEEWLRLVNHASRAVHSNAHMANADKVPVLANLAKLRKGLEDLLQLKLFPDSGLDFDS